MKNRGIQGLQDLGTMVEDPGIAGFRSQDV